MRNDLSLLLAGMLVAFSACRPETKPVVDGGDMGVGDAGVDVDPDTRAPDLAAVDMPGLDASDFGGDVAIPELSDVVEIRYDDYRLPHISCATEADCFLALGYVHARHRFFGMDYHRRAVRGRRSELVGPSAVDQDVAARRYFSSPAGEPLEEVVWEKLDDRTRAIHRAYARGVNRWLGEMKAGEATFPPAYGHEIEGRPMLEAARRDSIPQWDPLDSIAISIGVAQSSGDNAFDIEMSTYAEDFPTNLYVDLFLPRPAPQAAGPNEIRRPFSPVEAPTVPDLPGAAAAVRELRESLDVGLDLSGSNNWAIGAGRTESGNALLAVDPHGGLGNASGIFAELNSGDGEWSLFGISLPGSPLFFVGHNQHLGWACTVSFTDLTDFYYEVLSNDGNAVRFQGRDVAITEREYQVDVAGEGVETRTMRFVPHHGPIVYEDPAGNFAISVRWRGHEGTREPDAYVGFMHAGNVEEALQAADQATANGCNEVFADDQGRVARKVMADVPSRPWAAAPTPPFTIVAGDGSQEWGAPIEDPVLQQAPGADGFVNSSNHFLDDAWADANPFDDGRPYLQNFAVPGHRYRAVRQALEGSESHRVSQTHALQFDSSPLQAAPIVELVSETMESAAPSPEAARFLDVLESWDGGCATGLTGIDPEGEAVSDPDVRASSAGCAAFQTLLVFLTRAAFADEFAEHGHADAFYPSTTTRLLHRLAVAPMTMATGESLWDDVSTDAVETRQEIVSSAVESAAAYLHGRLGEDPDGWLWGRIHTLTLETFPDIPSFRLGPYASPATFTGVNPSLWGFHETVDFVQVNGAVLRMVVEFGPEGPQTWVQVPGTLDTTTPEAMDELWLRDYLLGRPHLVTGEGESESLVLEPR